MHLFDTKDWTYSKKPVKPDGKKTDGEKSGGEKSRGDKSGGDKPGDDKSGDDKSIVKIRMFRRSIIDED